MHSQADHAQLTGKVFASCEIELSDIHLLENFDIPWVKRSGKWKGEREDECETELFEGLCGDVLRPHIQDERLDPSPTLKLHTVLEVEARKTLRKVLDIP